MKSASSRIFRRCALVLALAGGLAVAHQPGTTQANGVPFLPGDVFAASTAGNVYHYNSAGALVDVLNNGLGSQYDTGMCTDGSGNLLATNFNGNNVTKYDSNGNVVNPTFLTTDPGGDVESCTLDGAGHIYVGQPDGNHNILEFDSAGNLINRFAPASVGRGTDWIDLAADQCTMLYAGESGTIGSFNVCTNTQNPDLTNALNDSCFALRIRPNGEVMIACSNEVYRLSSTGAILQTYPAASFGDSGLFAMNLDPDNHSFWTAGITSNKIDKVDINTGALEQQFSPNTASNQVYGLLVYGQIVVACTPPTIKVKSVVNGTATFAVQDQTQGTAAIVVNQSTNANTTVPPFVPGTTAEIDVTSQKITTGVSSHVELTAFAPGGCSTTFDPLMTSTLRENGKPQTDNYSGILQSESSVIVSNGSPGVDNMKIDVNGKSFMLNKLQSGQQSTLDISSALKAGPNTISVTSVGKPGGSAGLYVGPPIK